MSKPDITLLQWKVTEANRTIQEFGGLVGFSLQLNIGTGVLQDVGTYPFAGAPFVGSTN